MALGWHKAADKGHTAIVSYLIEMGAEVDVRDEVLLFVTVMVVDRHSCLTTSTVFWMLMSGVRCGVTE
jgi:hypothetical protein